jgi:hypothetical protein
VSADERFAAFLARVRAELMRRDDVVGLVAMGSTADTSRADEWSDHDLAVVTAPGAQRAYRDPGTWLPDPERIVFAVQEWHGGVKVLYDDGHLAEFGVADVAELSAWSVGNYDVLIDLGGVAEAMSEARRGCIPAPLRAEDALRLVVFHVLVGVGRARRGERLAAHTSVRHDAVGAFLHALRDAHRSPDDALLDALDPFRRVERVHPAVAARIDALLETDVEQAARSLLDLVVEVFPGDVPASAVRVARERLGRHTVSA